MVESMELVCTPFPSRIILNPRSAGPIYGLANAHLLLSAVDGGAH